MSVYFEQFLYVCTGKWMHRGYCSWIERLWLQN